MLGIASPLLIKLRVRMRNLFVKEAGMSLDCPLPDPVRQICVDYIVELVSTGQLKFNRCVRPVGKVKLFILIVFWDGSDNAYAAVIYFKWVMEE